MAVYPALVLTTPTPTGAALADPDGADTADEPGSAADNGGGHADTDERGKSEGHRQDG